jgi:FkbM family methyltransferase
MTTDSTRSFLEWDGHSGVWASKTRLFFDEMRLLRLACRTVFEKAGYALIWIAKRCYAAPEEERDARRSKRVAAWRDVDGDRTLRFEYPLSSESLVFDVGGFHGDWTAELVARFLCRVEIFEPVSNFANQLEHRFSGNDRVNVNRFGLSAATGTADLDLRGESSSMVVRWHAADTEAVQIVDIAAYMDGLGDRDVDLMKINIEGAEYDLLDRVLALGLADRFRFLQIQFHDDVENAHDRMRTIQAGLAATHEPAWQYPFIWESWERRGG